MTSKIVAQGIALLLGLLGSAFGLYLTYLTLVHIQATELMWFVFTIYVPMIVVFQILSKVAEMLEDKA